MAGNDDQIGLDAAMDWLSMPTGIPTAMKSLTPPQATAAMRRLAEVPAYTQAALQRGTGAAMVNLYLNHRAAGVEVDEGALQRMAAGLGPAKAQ